MVDLNDVLSEAIVKGFYKNKKDTRDAFYKFAYFGSHMCPANVYDSNGKYIERTNVLTNERRNYKLIPEDQLPEKLRVQESQLTEQERLKRISQLDAILPALDSICNIGKKKRRNKSS